MQQDPRSVSRRADQCEVTRAVVTTRSAKSSSFTNDLAVWSDDARTRRHRLLNTVGRCGLVPLLQFLAVGRDEAQHGSWIQTGDRDRLETLASLLDGDGVGVGVMGDLHDAMKQDPNFYPLVSASARLAN